MSHLGGLVQDYGGGHCGYKNITLVSIDTLFTKQDTQVEFRLFSDAKNVSKHGTGLTIFSRASLVHAHTLVKQRHILVLYKVHTAHLDLHYRRAMLAANNSEQFDRVTTATKTMFSSHLLGDQRLRGRRGKLYELLYAPPVPENYRGGSAISRLRQKIPRPTPLFNHRVLAPSFALPIALEDCARSGNHLESLVLRCVRYMFGSIFW